MGRRTRIALLALAVIGSVSLLASLALGEVPKRINYQGLLRDVGTGEPLKGEHGVVFKLYADSVGGSELWSETDTLQADAQGVVSAVLGTKQPIDIVLDGTIWLEVAVDGETLAPRRQIVSVPYALRAGSSETADSLGGSVDWTHVTNVPPGFADGVDNVGGAGDGYSLDAADGNPVDAVYVNNSGEVGIGTTDPQYPLHVDNPSGVAGATAIYGVASSSGAVSVTYGVWGQTNSNDVVSPGAGVIGFSNTGAGRSSGVIGMTVSQNGTGVKGAAVSTSGQNCGVYGTTNSPNGYAGYFMGGRNYFGGKVGIGTESPGNLIHVEGAGTAAGGVAGYNEVVGRFRQAGGGHSAISVDGISGQDAILYFAENGKAIWDLRSDASAGKEFQLRYLGGTASAKRYLTVDSTGHVGIGTEIPFGKLQVTETVDAGLACPLKVENRGYNSGTATGITFQVDGGSEDRGKGAIVYERTNTYNRGDFHILQDANANFDMANLADAVVTIKNDGKVGIGTKAPTALLHIYSSGTTPIIAENTGTTNKAIICGSAYALSCQTGTTAAVHCWNTVDNYVGELAGIGFGVYGQAPGNVYAYLAQGTSAGYFHGNVTIYGDLAVSGSVSKSSGSFRIDHPLDPENKYLSHSFVESPDMMNVYNGNVVLGAGGEAWVDLPDWFEALNRDFRYQLTCIGEFAPVYVAEKISGNRFKVAGGRPGVEVSWQVTGIRQDPYAQQHRIPVEEIKPAGERGRYLNPDVYSKPETLGISYVPKPGPGE